MKRILSLLALSGLLVAGGCEQDEKIVTEKAWETWVPHYIRNYQEVEFGAFANTCAIYLMEINNHGGYGIGSSYFYELAERHGDLYYPYEVWKEEQQKKQEPALTGPRPIADLPSYTYYIVPDLNAVTITADTDWGETHPAGTSLNELFTVSGFTHAYDFIRNGYKSDDSSQIQEKPLSEIKTGNLWCLQSGDFYSIPYSILTFQPTTQALPSNSRFTLILTTYEGDEIVIPVLSQEEYEARYGQKEDE